VRLRHVIPQASQPLATGVFPEVLTSRRDQMEGKLCQPSQSMGRLVTCKAVQFLTGRVPRIGMIRAALRSRRADGRVEGDITLPGCRVTVGRDAQVFANISAREVVVLGRIRGNINASDRVDIRSGASLTGDVNAYRVNIGDGASFKGGLDKRPGQ
jgi:Polymer-forming cytoskeletal